MLSKINKGTILDAVIRKQKDEYYNICKTREAINAVIKKLEKEPISIWEGKERMKIMVIDKLKGKVFEIDKYTRKYLRNRAEEKGRIIIKHRKLTTEQKESITEMLIDKKLKQIEIAKIHGITQGMISKISIKINEG